jgi:hypothetical protein
MCTMLGASIAFSFHRRYEMFVLCVDDKRGTDVGIHAGNAYNCGFVTQFNEHAVSRAFECGTSHDGGDCDGVVSS